MTLDPSSQPFLDHIAELRMRLMWGVDCFAGRDRYLLPLC
jgi:hypothetical protein